MKLYKPRNVTIILALGLFLLPSLVCAEDKRQESIEMYVVIDGSAALKNVRQTVLAWFEEQILNGILQDGDRLSVWVAGEKAELIFSETLSGPESRKMLRDTLDSAPSEAKNADFAGALREISARRGASNGVLPPNTLLITSASGGVYTSLGESIGRILRYSRVEDFSGWRAIRILTTIGPQVQDAAGAYLRQGS
ncbi:hypothetical protein FACS1894147_11610 [Spirochaetia bacterium]|nr:hypothetical protein FACS1894147_11610 [Spirochaetia bacterium]